MNEEANMQRAIDISERAMLLLAEATGGTWAELAGCLLGLEPGVAGYLTAVAESYFPVLDGDVGAAFMCGVAYGVAAGRS